MGLVGVPGVFLRDKDYGGDSGPYDSHQIRPTNVQINKNNAPKKAAIWERLSLRVPDLERPEGVY